MLVCLGKLAGGFPGFTNLDGFAEREWWEVEDKPAVICRW